MVQVRVGEYDDRLALGEQLGERLLQGHDTEPGVDEHVDPLTAHVPGVRALSSSFTCGSSINVTESSTRVTAYHGDATGRDD